MRVAVCLYAGGICVGGRCVDNVHQVNGLAVELSLAGREVLVLDPDTGREQRIRCEGFLVTRWVGQRNVGTAWLPFDGDSHADSERIVRAVGEALRTLPDRAVRTAPAWGEMPEM